MHAPFGGMPTTCPKITQIQLPYMRKIDAYTAENPGTLTQNPKNYP
jgi:hypothetical protein